MVINYKGNKYPFRYVNFEGQVVIISTAKLDSMLFKSNEYTDKLAEYIDNQIIFFVEDDEIAENDNYFHKLLTNNIA